MALVGKSSSSSSNSSGSGRGGSGRGGSNSRGSSGGGGSGGMGGSGRRGGSSSNSSSSNNKGSSSRSINAGGGVGARGGGGSKDWGSAPPKVPEGGSPSTYFFLVGNNVVNFLGTRALQARVTMADRVVVERRRKLVVFLNYLEKCRHFYPGALPAEIYSGKEKFVALLEKIFSREHAPRQRFFTEDDKNRAELLYMWAYDVNCIRAPEPGNDDSSSSSDHDDAVGSTAGRAATAASSSSASSRRGSRAPRNGTNDAGRANANADSANEPGENWPIRKPPRNHRIWGVNGIMHGIALTGRNGTSKTTNPDYLHQKRSAKVFGHNGLTVGAWFPYQICAVFHGAHGHIQGGIHGSKDVGAYSVIVSGTYDGLDEDDGYVLWYSGSGSMDNKDPERPPPRTDATTALHVNYDRGKLVRVIRKAIERKKNNHSYWAPARGFRYDGLYRVIQVLTAANNHGGKYEKFKLKREPDQPPLESLTNIPSDEQIEAYEKVKEGF